MKWTPRDVIVLILVLALVLHPLATLVILMWTGRPLTDASSAAIEQILVAMIAVISGYVVGRRNGN